MQVVPHPDFMVFTGNANPGLAAEIAGHLGITLGAAFAVPVHAQSLLDLYESARGYDATWQSAKAQYDASLYRAEQSRAGLLPSANLSAGATRSNFDNNLAQAPADWQVRECGNMEVHPLLGWAPSDDSV